MSNKEKTTLKGKTASVVLTLCFVAVIAMTGLFVYSSRQAKEKEQLIKENQLASAEQEQSTAAATDDVVNTEPPTGASDTGTSTGTDTGAVTGADPDSDKNSSGNTAADTSDTDTETSALPEGLWFDEDSTLAWPASGTAIMNYNMDQTVYFKTLDQYRYNPALIISGEVGEEIDAAAAGVVENINVEPQTGVTITLNMGNGYEAVYGQLKEVPVQVGDYLDAGTLIGYLSEPTKYYAEEGTNLYFEVVKDGEAVDPALFME